MQEVSRAGGVPFILCFLHYLMRKGRTMKLKLSHADALIVVDVQKDFCPGGALAVPSGDKVVPVINGYIDKFTAKSLPVFATRDWHPRNHISFKAYGGIWPVHCVKETDGANFHPDLRLPASAVIISKATRSGKEAYSGFQGTRLKSMLRRLRVQRLFIGGLATDYCVKNTVLDALGSGFTVFFLIDASRGVDVNPRDSEKAVEQMLGAGASGIMIREIV